MVGIIPKIRQYDAQNGLLFFRKIDLVRFRVCYNPRSKEKNNQRKDDMESCWQGKCFAVLAAAGLGKMLVFSAAVGLSAVAVGMDAAGNLLKNGDKYKITYSAQNGAVTLTRSQTQPALLTITNQEVGEKESEEAGEATLTLTKKVTYKGSPMRVNAAYYIGIFKSREIKKENLLGTVSTSVRALALRNSSQESSKPMTVRLDKVATHEVTLYFAETDREGNPVTSGTSTGYNISINGQSGNVAKVTLNAKNPKAEVVVTNDIISGGAQEQRLLNSSSGFAGDRTALAEAQEISNDATAGVASRTGDDTPILPLLGILGGSAAVILLAVLILRRRRK